MSVDDPATATIEVTIGHSPLAFLYRLFRPNVRLDGELHRRPWGTHAFTVAPGLHTVEVSYPWLFSPECGRNGVAVRVHPGEVKRVVYRAGVLRFVPGRIRVEDALPEARVVR
jgi:hypothetical protein